MGCLPDIELNFALARADNFVATHILPKQLNFMIRILESVLEEQQLWWLDQYHGSGT